MPMELSEKGAVFIRLHEGFVDHWYLDPVNVPTIGVGFTWRSTAFREWWAKNRPGQKFAAGATMTRAEADDALRFLCAREYGAAVNTFLGKTVKQHVFDGMTSPVFNLGPGSLKWKWAAAAKEGNLSTAASLLRDTGTTAKGKKLAGLVKRRREEAKLLEFGDYGLIGDTTMHDSDPLSDGVLVRGERGRPVLDLQKSLNRLGYYKGAADGIFGYGTEAAVLDFQRDNGLKADGYAGPQTLAQLNKPSKPAPTSAKPAPEPEPEDAIAPPPAKTNWLALLIQFIAALFKRSR